MSIAKSRVGRTGLSSVFSLVCGGDGAPELDRKYARGSVRLVSSAHEWLVAYAFGVAACEPAYMNWPDEPRKTIHAVRSSDGRDC